MVSGINSLLKNKFTIVCGGSAGSREELERSILDADISFETKITPKFFPKKFGPFKFKIKKTLDEILSKDKAIKNNGPDFLAKYYDILDIRHLRNRRPASMSFGQRTEASLILDIAQRKKDYLYCDTVLKIPSLYFIIASTLNKTDYYNRSGGRFIWITQQTYDELLESMLLYAPDVSFEIFELVGKDIVCHEDAYTDLKEYLSKKIDKLYSDFERLKKLESYIRKLRHNKFDTNNTNELYEILKETNDCAYYRNIIDIADAHEEEFLHQDILMHCLAEYKSVPKQADCIKQAKEFLENINVKELTEVDVINAFQFFKNSHDFILWSDLLDILEPLSARSEAFEKLCQLSNLYHDKELDDLDYIDDDTDDVY